MNTAKLTLQEVAARLEAVLPPYTAETQPVTAKLYRLLAEGQPVSRQRIITSLALPAVSVDNVLHQFGSRITYDDTGQIVAFGGLSLQPTAHRFAVNGRALYAWCAWDTLFIPAILKQTAQVESTCPVTGTSIRLLVTPEKVTHCDPASTMLSFVIPESAACHEDVVGNFCCYVQFFCSAQAGATWIAQNEGSFLLSVEEAYEIGRQRVATRLDTL
ncbi:MAG: alkylmercury lyase MerB [Candidatus Tectomicrobia bacterium]